MILEASFERF